MSMVSKSDTSIIVSPLSDHSLAMFSPANTLQKSRQSCKTSPQIKAGPSLTNENLASSFPIPLLTIPVSESHVNGTFEPFKSHQNQQHPFSNITQQQQQQMNTVTDFLADLQRHHAQQQQQWQIQQQQDWFKTLIASIERQLQGSFNQNNNLLSSSPAQNQIPTEFAGLMRIAQQMAPNQSQQQQFPAQLLPLVRVSIFVNIFLNNRTKYLIVYDLVSCGNNTKTPTTTTTTSCCCSPI